MRAHFFLVTSYTCAAYLWSNMASPAPVIISAFQQVGQKIILPFGSDISPLLNFHWPKYLPWSWQTWGWWAHRRAGECEPTSEHSWRVTRATTLHSLNMQPLCTPFTIWNQSAVPNWVLTVASWPAYRFLRRQVRWSGIPISLRIFQFVVIHTVKRL